MRDYAKVRPKFWTQGTGKRLRGDADTQVVAHYLMTGPTGHMTGVFYCPLPTLCHETGVSLEGASKALRRLAEEGFAFFDPTFDLMWVPNMAREQIGASLKPRDNLVPNICKHLAKLGNHPFCMDFVHRYQGPYNLPPELVGRPLEGAWAEGGQQGGSEALRSQRTEIRDQGAVVVAPRAIRVPSAPEHCSRVNGTTTAPNGSTRVSGQDAAAVWQRVVAMPGGNPLDAHTYSHHAKHFDLIAAACNAVVLEHAAAKPANALQAVVEWFWHAPDGAVQSGRVDRSAATPQLLATGITKDLTRASEWWLRRKQQSQQPEPHEAAQ